MVVRVVGFAREGVPDAVFDGESVEDEMAGDSMRTTVWGRDVVAGGVTGATGTVRGSAVAVRIG
ncbi:hypothetical protein VAR608DRAFT_6743 [Variovorax sp. HW608]|nr:hypothetical protein VAR608DRAFT_6743 [Variovorax sp. HW608]